MALSNVRVTARPVAVPLTTQVAPVGADLDFDPRDQGRCALWLSGRPLGIASGSAVSGWPDRSGWGRHAQASGTARPTVVLGAVNGKQALQFDGSDDTMSIPTAPDLNARTGQFWISVMRADNTSSIAIAKRNNTDTNFWEAGVSSAGTELYRVGAGAAVQGPSGNLTGIYRIESGTYDAITQTVYINGAASSSSSRTVNSTNTTAVSIGSRENFPGSEARLHGFIADQILHARIVLQSEWKRQLRRLHRLYGIAVAP